MIWEEDAVENLLPLCRLFEKRVLQAEGCEEL